MDKQIKLKMDNEKNIIISRDEYEIVITKREISADQIFKLFDHSIGDTYNITIDNPNNFDNEVLNNFKNLLNDIKEQIEKIQDTF